MTMRDIAKKLGVSVATVSRALNNQNNVNEETKKKILDLVKELNYTPNAIARNLSKNENNNVALIVPDLENMFFAKLVSNICRYFYKKGCQVTVYNSGGIERKEMEIIETVIKFRMEAVIAIPIKSLYETIPYLELKKRGILCLLLDREIENEKFGGVFIDNFKGAYLLTQKLIKEGHKRISFISGDPKLKTARDRVEGFMSALKDNELELHSEDIYFGDFSIESGKKAGKKIMLGKTSAILAANNQMFIGMLNEIQNTPRKFRLASFDSIDILSNIGYDFLTLNLPIEEIEIAKELFKMIKEKKEKEIFIEPVIKE
ncbi:MAG: LacI family DNA-binding transcriptional regulator [Fusobacteriaceae bacterium]